MRSEQLAGLVMGTPVGIRLACRRIADIERPVAPHRVHDHCQLARHRHAGLAMAVALAIAWPQLFTLSEPLKRVINPDAAW